MKYNSIVRSLAAGCIQVQFSILSKNSIYSMKRPGWCICLVPGPASCATYPCKQPFSNHPLFCIFVFFNLYSLIGIWYLYIVQPTPCKQPFSNHLIHQLLFCILCFFLYFVFLCLSLFILFVCCSQLSTCKKQSSKKARLTLENYFHIFCQLLT